MCNYTKNFIKSLRLFPSHHLLPWTTKINVLNLDIRRCAPTPGHYTAYRRSRGGRRVFKKLAQTASTIATRLTGQRHTTPRISGANLENLLAVPINSKLHHKIQPCTTLSIINIRSLLSKAELLKYHIIEKSIDVCAITESWIQTNAAEESLKSTVPNGYAISSKPCDDGRRGGGIALIYNKEPTTLVKDSSFEFTEAECVLFTIGINQRQLDLCVLYRYPEGNVFTFFEELSTVIEQTVTSSNELLILGDFNIKADLHNAADTQNLKDFPDLFNL